MNTDYRWIPTTDTTVRAEHRDADRRVFVSPVSGRFWSPACRCYATPIPLERLPIRYPKRWSRAKRKEARVREMRAVDRAVARVLAVVRKFRRAP
jgi:hypothetical protein